MTSAILAFASFFVALISTAVASPSIVGGQTMSASDSIAKSVVAIYFTTGQKDPNGQPLGGLCTGTLLNSEYVLTAAHCVTDMKAGVVIFAPSISDAKTNPGVVRKILNAGFNLDYPLAPVLEHNDIGLVKFEGGIPQGYFPAVILDPKVSMNYVKPGQAITIVGYGTTGNDPSMKDSAGTLRKLVTVIDSVSANAKEITIGSNGKVACHGDSGGPALVTVKGKNYIWGVASRSDCVNFSIYTRLTSNFYGAIGMP